MLMEHGIPAVIQISRQLLEVSIVTSSHGPLIYAAQAIMFEQIISAIRSLLLNCTSNM